MPGFRKGMVPAGPHKNVWPLLFTDEVPGSVDREPIGYLQMTSWIFSPSLFPWRPIFAS